MPYLRQSTTQTVRFGPCLDKDDGSTEETGLTLTQADMRLSKDGAAFAQKGSAGNATHDSDGWYSTSLSTTDTGTVGELILNVHQPANMLPVWLRWWVLEEEVYDDIFGAAAVGYLKPTTAGRDLDVSTTGEAGLDFDNIKDASGAKTLTNITVPIVTTVGTTTLNTDMVTEPPTVIAIRQEMDSNSVDLNTLLTRITEARMSEMDAGTGGKMANQMDLVKTEADKIALADAGAGVAGSVIEEVENRSTHTAADVWTSGTRTLTSFGTLIADMWHHLLTAITTAGSIGKLIKDEITSVRMATLTDWINGGRLDLILDARSSQATADAIEVDTQDIQSRIPAALVGGRMDSDVGAKTGNVALSAQEKLDVNIEVDSSFTTQMADSVPADGTIATREQAIYMIVQMLTEFSISGVTLTTKKVDGSTTLMTFTLDDATNPTSITRTT